jgi:hypothetical protein
MFCEKTKSASVDDIRASREHDQRVCHVLILLPTNGFQTYFLNRYLYVSYISPIHHFLE